MKNSTGFFGSFIPNVNVSFSRISGLCSISTPNENIRKPLQFSVFRRYRNEILTWNGLNIIFKYNWVKLFKNGPSKICGRQPLQNLKFFKGCLAQILIGPFLGALTYNIIHFQKICIETKTKPCSRIKLNPKNLKAYQLWSTVVTLKQQEKHCKWKLILLWQFAKW